MNHLAHFVLSGNDDDLAIGNFVADFITNRQLPNFTEGVQRGIWLHRAIDAFTDAHPVVKQSTKRLHPFHHKYAPVIVDIYYDFLLAKNWDKFGELKIKNSELKINSALNFGELKIKNSELKINSALNFDELKLKNEELKTNSELNSGGLIFNSSFLIFNSKPLPVFVKNAYNLLNSRLLELPERLQTYLPRMIADDFLMKSTTFKGLEFIFERIEKSAAFPGNFSTAAAHLEDYLEEFDAEFCLFFPDLQAHVVAFLKKNKKKLTI